MLHLRVMITGVMRQDQTDVGQGERDIGFNNKIVSLPFANIFVSMQKWNNVFIVFFFNI